MDNIRVRAVGRSASAQTHKPATQTPEPSPALQEKVSRIVQAAPKYSVYFEGGRVDTPFVKLQDLSPLSAVPGPAVIIGL